MSNAFEVEIKKEINILRESIDKKTITLSDKLVDINNKIELVKTVLDNFFGYLLNEFNKHIIVEKYIDFKEIIQAFRDQLKGSYVISRKAVEEYINEEDKTDLQKEVEGLSFNQFVHRLTRLAHFGTFQDSLIYIDWLYREIIKDLREFVYKDYTYNQKLIAKYEKLFKEKEEKTNE